MDTLAVRRQLRYYSSPTAGSGLGQELPDANFHAVQVPRCRSNVVGSARNGQGGEVAVVAQATCLLQVGFARRFGTKPPS